MHSMNPSSIPLPDPLKGQSRRVVLPASSQLGVGRRSSVLSVPAFTLYPLFSEW